MRHRKARIRVAFLTPSLNPGGAERQMLTLAAMLPKAAFEVRFLLLWERGTWAAEAEALGVPVDLLGLRRDQCAPLRPRCLTDLLQAVRRFVALTRDVDIVDAWLVPSFTFAGFAQPIARVPILVAGRRSLADLYRSKPWYRKVAARWATRAMDAVVANSRAAAREAIVSERIDRARVHVIPNAVVPVEISSAERLRYRRAWGFSDRHVVVGCVANYKPGKGLEALVEVAAHLRDDAPELRYVFVGEGPLRATLAGQIAKHGLGSIIFLNGLAEDARRVYPAFDIAVQASASEGLPNVILEAAAAGLPVVATAVGGTSDVLTSEENALLVPDADSGRLASAILRLTKDAGLRERLGAAARERSTDFSPARLAGSTGALYERLLGKRPRAAKDRRLTSVRRACRRTRLRGPG
jgi:L-malate glycosyltransferase